MYPILGKPFLEWTLESLLASRRFDASRDGITIVVGHFSEQIFSYFGESWRGVPLAYARQDQALGTAHAVAIGREGLSRDAAAVIIQADVWAPPEFFDALLDDPRPDALSVIRHVCSERHDERVDVRDGLVTKAWKGSSEFVECGIWKFSPAMMEFMMSRKEDEYRALASVQAAIESGLPVGAVERGDWVHLGGTEPSVEANLASVHASLAQEYAGHPSVYAEPGQATKPSDSGTAARRTP